MSRFKVQSLIAITVVSLLLFIACNVGNANNDISDPETILNPGKSLFDMVRELTFDGIEFKLPCTVSEMPGGFSLLDESFIGTGDRFELLLNEKVAGFVITKDGKEDDNSLIYILSIDLVPPENEEENYCDFAMGGIGFSGVKKSEIELIFNEYTFTGDKSLIVYSFIDGSVIFNFDEKGICNFIVIGGGVGNTPAAQ